MDRKSVSKSYGVISWNRINEAVFTTRASAELPATFRKLEAARERKWLPRAVRPCEQKPIVRFFPANVSPSLRKIRGSGAVFERKTEPLVSGV